MIVRAGLVKRTITLPRSVRGSTVQSAKFDADRLNIILGGEHYEQGVVN